MSWFDSSFSFAKTALTQAQKSLDSVLDINEDEVQPEIDESSSFIPTPSPASATSAKATPPTLQAAPTTHITSQSQSSSEVQQSKPSQDRSQEKIKSDSSTTALSSTKAAGSSATWGGAGSFWTSSYSRPSPAKSGTASRDTAKSGTAKKAGKQPSSKSAESVATTSAKPAGTPLSRQSSRSTESAALRDTPHSKTPTKSADSVSNTPESREGNSVVYDMQDQLRDVRLGGPAMTSTPVAEDPGRSMRHQRDKPPSGGEKQESEPPISPLSSKSPTDRRGNNPLPDPSQITSAELAATSGVDATDSSVCEDGAHPEQVVGTNKGAETASGKDVDIISSSVGVGTEGEGDAKGTGDMKESKQEHKVTGREDEVSPGGVTIQDTHTAAMHEENRGDLKEGGHETEAASSLVTLEVSPAMEELNSSPATLEVSSTVEEQLETVSPGLDTTTEPPTAAAKPLKVEVGGATSPESVVSPASVGEGSFASLKDNEGSFLVEQTVTHTEGQFPSAVVTPDVLTGQQEEEEVQKLKKELLHARHVLEVREQKMVLMSQQIVEYMETNQTLQSELEELRGAAQSDVQEMREEFTKRIGMSEKKLQGVIKERDSLKKQLAAFQNEQTQQKRSEGDELSKVLSEKDENISQLLEEGEKLSKQELQSNGIIKKLRLKERQNDQLLAAQRQQVDDLEGKVKSLKDQIKKKEETEKKYQESLAQLNTIAEQQAKELATLKTEKDGLLERVRSLQTNLDNSYKELAGLQKANAVNRSAAHEAAASAEMTKQEEVKIKLEQQKVVSQKERESLIIQIEELRMSVSRAEQQFAWKEDHMNQEIANVQTRLQEAEDRNQELTTTIAQATKPLLRQIENLQSAHSAQSTNWEKIENSLNRRLVEAQTQLNVALEKERSAVEKHMILKSRVGALETQLSSVKQEKSQLLATVELERAKLETLEESQHRESSKLEALRASYQQSTEGLRKEKEMLERQLEYERVRLEAESRKACLESQEKERLRSQLANSLSSLNHSMSRQSSSGSQSEYPERGSQSRENNRTESSSGEIPLLGTHMRGGSAVALEHLQALLKQKEGELANVQNLSGSLERSRAAMVEDLAKLSTQNEVLNQQVEKIPSLQKELEAVRQKHEAMLQMYGEKAEEAEELKLDIQDLKSMYRQQIDELVGRRRH